MKKNIGTIMLSLAILVFVLSGTHAYSMDIISAKKATEITKKSTVALTNKLLKSKNGKKAYELLTTIINNSINEVAKGGYYNVCNISVINTNGLEKIKKLVPEDNEYDLLKSIVENKLIQKGYHVERGKYDYSGSFNFYISWSKK